LVCHIDGGTWLRVLENRVPRKIFGLKRDEITEEWRRLHKGEFTVCTYHQILFGESNQEEWYGRACSTYSVEEKCTQGFGGKA
jgi:hypothetical protein